MYVFFFCLFFLPKSIEFYHLSVIGNVVTFISLLIPDIWDICFAFRKKSTSLPQNRRKNPIKLCFIAKTSL